MAPVPRDTTLSLVEGFTAAGDYARTVHLRAEDGMRAAVCTWGGTPAGFAHARREAARLADAHA